MNEIVSDLGEAAAKSIPAVAVLTFNLQDGLAVLAIIWTALQIAHLIWKWRRDLSAK